MEGCHTVYTGWPVPVSLHVDHMIYYILRVIDDANIYIGHACLCVCICLSLAVCTHYCTDPDVTLGNVRGAPN